MEKHNAFVTKSSVLPISLELWLYVTLWILSGANYLDMIWYAVEFVGGLSVKLTMLLKTSTFLHEAELMQLVDNWEAKCNDHHSFTTNMGTSFIFGSGWVCHWNSITRCKGPSRVRGELLMHIIADEAYSPYLLNAVVKSWCHTVNISWMQQNKRTGRIYKIGMTAWHTIALLPFISQLRIIGRCKSSTMSSAVRGLLLSEC